jgi:hypothetical protein
MWVPTTHYNDPWFLGPQIGLLVSWLMSEIRVFLVKGFLLNLLDLSVKFQLKCISYPLISQPVVQQDLREDRISIKNVWELIRNYIG